MPERAALVAVLILERPLCLRCLAVKSGLPVAELDGVIAHIRRSLKLHRVTDTCSQCGAVEVVLSAERPA